MACKLLLAFKRVRYFKIKQNRSQSHFKLLMDDTGVFADASSKSYLQELLRRLFGHLDSKVYRQHQNQRAGQDENREFLHFWQVVLLSRFLILS